MGKKILFWLTSYSDFELLVETAIFCCMSNSNHMIKAIYYHSNNIDDTALTFYKDNFSSIRLAAAQSVLWKHDNFENNDFSKVLFSYSVGSAPALIIGSNTITWTSYNDKTGESEISIAKSDYDIAIGYASTSSDAVASALSTSGIPIFKPSFDSTSAILPGKSFAENHTYAMPTAAGLLLKLANGDSSRLLETRLQASTNIYTNIFVFEAKNHFDYAAILVNDDGETTYYNTPISAIYEPLIASDSGDINPGYNYGYAKINSSISVLCPNTNGWMISSIVLCSSSSFLQMNCWNEMRFSAKTDELLNSNENILSASYVSSEAKTQDSSFETDISKWIVISSDSVCEKVEDNCYYYKIKYKWNSARAMLDLIFNS